jgi:hypothetical protein
MNTGFGSPESRPWFATALNWTIFIAFMAIVGNWPAYRPEFRALQEKRGQEIQEHPLLKEKFSALHEEFEALTKSRTLTPEKAAEIQWKFVEIQARLDIRSGLAEVVYKSALEIFADSYSFLPGESEVLKFRPELLNHIVEVKFNERFLLAREKARGGAPVQITTGQLVGAGVWLVRWYYLLTIPTLIVVLVGLRRKQRTAETLLVHGLTVAKHCLLGPVGVFLLSDSVNTTRRYRQLESQLLEKRGSEGRLTEDEREAIWLQINEPVVRFDQALEQIRSGSVKVQKPLLACTLIWLTSLSYGSGNIASNLWPTTVISTWLADGWQGGIEETPESDDAIVPAAPATEMLTIVERKWGIAPVVVALKPVASWRGPRGPPTVEGSPVNGSRNLPSLSQRKVGSDEQV